MNQTQTPSATAEQQAFISELCSGRPCFLSARAGTGKTTTIKLAVQALRAQLGTRWHPQSICAIAFNKANQLDLQKALGTDVHVMTLHALGFQALRSAIPGIEIEDSKIFNLLKMKSSRLRKREVFADTLRLVSSAKNWGVVREGAFGPWKLKPLITPSSDTWSELKSHFELWNADESVADEVLQESLEQALGSNPVIDYDDMVYLPVVLGLPIWGAERLVVDEAQDLSPLNLAMLKKCPSKKWFVGDPYQCIYGWRGAKEDVVESLGLPVLPLTNCWRCSKEIIQEAQKFVPDIRTSNPEAGPVQRLTWLPNWSKERPAVVLSRRNSELVSLALHLRRERVQAFIQGKSFTKTLLEILKGLRGQNKTQLLGSLKAWLDKSLDAYPHKSGELKDYAECLREFIFEGQGRSGAEKLIAESFTDSPAPGAWILSTIHKAKGKEWPRVYLLSWTPKGTQPWQRKEERNLFYVAVTRAQNQLVWIEESAWKPEKENWAGTQPGKIDVMSWKKGPAEMPAFGWDLSGEAR